jgi:putative ABC transport system permease protein
MALTVIGSLVVSAARRTRDLAYLRTLGVTSSQALALTLIESVPPVVLALLPGVALGIGIALVCLPGLGLASFVAARDVPSFVDWPGLGILVFALIALVTAAVGGATWLSRRAGFVNAMRLED